MRSLKEQITLLVMGCIVLLTASFMLAFYFQLRSIALLASETKARSDLATAEAIIDLKYPGPWHIRGGELYKGNTKINNNFSIVDYIHKLTGDSCTIFLNDIRVTTTIREKNGNRAIGTHASPEVTNKVLGAKQQYIGEAVVVGELYQTAYKPLLNEKNDVVGMLYVGAPKTLYETILYNSLKIMGLAAFIFDLLIGALLWSFIKRKIEEPLREVVEGTRNATLKGDINPLSGNGSSEIKELIQAFNHMLADILILNNRLSKASNNEPPQAEDSENQNVQQKDIHKLNEERSDNWLDSLLSAENDLPKGLNRATLKEILTYMKTRKGEDFTIQKISDELFLSRVTVSRYFDYLEQCGIIDVEQKYGSIGRPVRIYRLKELT